MAIDGALTMKRVLRFSVGLLVNVFILFILVKVFASNSCKDKADTKVVAVTILPDSSIKDVCETLDDAGVVKNAYALMIRIRIGSYAAKIQPGTYEIAPNYTNDEIITVITGGKLDEKEKKAESKKEEKAKDKTSDSTTDAESENDTTEKSE